MSVADTVRTGKRSLQFFRGGSKFQVYIGIVDFWIHSLKRYRPPDVVALDNVRNGKSNHTSD